VEAVLKKANATVKSFTMFVVGEGIEKKSENFADEVAKASQISKPGDSGAAVPA
jgi:elongation factor Ts